MSSVPRIEIGAGHHPQSERLTVALRTPYDEMFVELLKSEIPRGHRGWDREGRMWWVSDEHRETAEKIILSRWSQMRVMGAEDGDYVVDHQGVVLEHQGRLPF